MSIRYVVLDFDGTCTRVEDVWEGFLAAYVAAIRAANPSGAPSEAEWSVALARVAAASPKAGWTLAGAPSTAPAAADPYIHAGEATAELVRHAPDLVVPGSAYADAYAANPAPWRDEVVAVLDALVGRGVNVGFISNSAGAGIAARLDQLLADRPELRGRIRIHGGARKFTIQEIPFTSGAAAAHLDRFERVPAVDLDGAAAIGRPVYLRRGAYFEAICGLWGDFGETGYPITETLFCGDVWELDLALPQALGAPVHLVRRAPPYVTYPYELARVPGAWQGTLGAVLARL